MLPPKAAGTVTRIAEKGDYKVDVRNCAACTFSMFYVSFSY